MEKSQALPGLIGQPLSSMPLQVLQAIHTRARANFSGMLPVNGNLSRRSGSRAGNSSRQGLSYSVPSVLKVLREASLRRLQLQEQSVGPGPISLD